MFDLCRLGHRLVVSDLCSGVLYAGIDSLTCSEMEIVAGSHTSLSSSSENSSQYDKLSDKLCQGSSQLILALRPFGLLYVSLACLKYNPR